MESTETLPNDSLPEKAPGGKLKGLVKALVVLLILVALVATLKYFGVLDTIQNALRGALEWIDGLGFWAPVLFIALYVFCCVVFIPGSVITLGAGVLFGVVNGSIYVSIASTLGATAAFLIGRYGLRDWVAKKIEGNQKFKAIDDAVATEGWKIVLLTRLSPVFPFNLLNYAFGITRVSLKGFFLASWIGMMPGTVMYVYIGSLAGDVATLGTGQLTLERFSEIARESLIEGHVKGVPEADGVKATRILDRGDAPQGGDLTGLETVTEGTFTEVEILRTDEGAVVGVIFKVNDTRVAADTDTEIRISEPATTAQWVIRIVGLLATVIVTVYVTRIARKALAKRVG